MFEVLKTVQVNWKQANVKAKQLKMIQCESSNEKKNNIRNKWNRWVARTRSFEMMNHFINAIVRALANACAAFHAHVKSHRGYFNYELNFVAIFGYFFFLVQKRKRKIKISSICRLMNKSSVANLISNEEQLWRLCKNFVVSFVIIDERIVCLNKRKIKFFGCWIMNFVSDISTILMFSFDVLVGLETTFFGLLSFTCSEKFALLICSFISIANYFFRFSFIFSVWNCCCRLLEQCVIRIDLVCFDILSFLCFSFFIFLVANTAKRPVNVSSVGKIIDSIAYIWSTSVKRVQSSAVLRRRFRERCVHKGDKIKSISSIFFV